MSARSWRWLLPGLLLASAGGAELRHRPEAGTLWEEDFRALKDGDDERLGWASAGPVELLVAPADGGVLVRAAGPRAAGSRRRRVPFDLSPAGEGRYLVLDLVGAESDIWAGVGLRCDARTLVEQAAEAGRWVFDLRRFLPALDGGAGSLAVALTAAGATEAAPGPWTAVRRLACVAQPPERLEVDCSSRDGRARPGDQVTITVHLAEPAEQVTCSLFVTGPPTRAASLDGRQWLELEPDENRTAWSARVRLTIDGTVGAVAGSRLLFRAQADDRPPLWTTAWFTPAAGDELHQRPRVAAGRAPTAPAVDGRLDDDAWRRAAPVGGFLRLGSADRAEPGTEFRVLADEQALYLAAVLTEPAMAGLRAETTERDGPVYRDDCLEVYLQPVPGGPYRQFVVNAAGTQFDSLVSADGSRIEPGWDAPWEAAAARHERAWTVELGIPWSALEVADGTGGAWGFNVARGRRAGGAAEYSSWARLETGFHEPRRFGRLADLPALEAYRIAVAPPAVEVFPDGDHLAAVLSLELTNQTREPLALTGRAAVRLGDKRRLVARQVVLAPGRPTTVRWPFDVPAEGRYEFAWQFESVLPPLTRLAGVRRIEVAWRPLALRWLSQPEEPEWVAEGALVPYLPDGLRLVAELYRGERLLAAQALSPVERTVRFRFAAPEPRDGCRLVVMLRLGEHDLGAFELPRP